MSDRKSEIGNRKGRGHCIASGPSLFGNCDFRSPISDFRFVVALALLICGVLAPVSATASGLGKEPIVSSAATPGAVQLVAGGNAAAIVVDPRDHPGVLRVANDLQQDIQRVTGVRPSVVTNAPSKANDVIIVGTLGVSRVVDRLVREGKLDVSEIRGRWEASILQVVERPLPGIARALVIAGSDKRGTIFGAYELSEQSGVSPWYWWADVPVRRQPELFARAGRLVRREPAVKYRGIFINDEAPALSNWARKTFGGFHHQFYARVFELILRLRANFLWPAMWGSAFNADDARNPALADEYGVVIGTSHHEPMMRAHDEWRRHGQGPWNYTTNAEALRAFWTDGIRKTAAFENIITLGMRGDGDEPMADSVNVALLERIVQDQRRIIAENRAPDVTTVPQVWALYKEVQEYYERGMRVPDDVTVLWSDDNWGNIRRLPTAEERQRAGGAGVYYHFDYVGGPRSYKWLNTIPIPKIWEQMHLAWRYGATRMWIVNVGDIKPMEFPIQFFLDYAWDPERWPAERLAEFTELWAAREFGAEHAAEIAALISSYTKYNGRRKPEMLEPQTFSLVNYREAETVVADFERLVSRAEAISSSISSAAKDAFYQLVLHPIKASAVLNELYVTVGRNRLYAAQGRASTNDLAARARELFAQDAEITRYYNETLAGGKWQHMMDQTHIGYTYWNQPFRNAMPGVQEIQPSNAAEMGVAVEGSPASWPGGNAPPPVLPALTVYDKTPRYIDIFNRGRQPFEYTVETSQTWLQVNPPRGIVDRDRRILVTARWNDVPLDTTSATITIRGSDNTQVQVAVPIVNPRSPRPGELDGFVETDGYVSIEAEHYSRAVAPVDRRWLTVPDHGRTLSGVTPWPVTPWPSAAAAVTDGANDMRLEYRMFLFTTGPIRVHAYLAPTQKFRPGPGLRYGIAFGDESTQVVDVHADTSLQAWERSVADGVTVSTSTHTIATPGVHILKFSALEPGLVLQKLVVDTGGLRPSYLGPPESARFEGR